MSYILGGFIVVFFVAFGSMCLFLGYLKKELQQVLKENENEQKRRNEQKESMETGDSSSDFDASVKLMHDLANRK